MAGEGQSVQAPLSVARTPAVVSAAASLQAPYADALVEIDGGGGLVEQRATQDAGSSVTACTTDTSAHWYLAEGFTADESNEQLVLSNPFDQSVIVDIGFATDEGSRQPPELQGYPISPRSVQVVDLDSVAARDEAQVAVSVVATKGHLVVGRAQLYKGGGRLGYSMTLASPALRSQWWFANGSKGGGFPSGSASTTRPTDAVAGRAAATSASARPRSPSTRSPVPAGEVVTYTSDTVAGLPDGRHAVVFDTGGSAQSLVVERAITRTIDGIPTTSVLLGAVATPEGVRADDVDAGGRPGRADRGRAGRLQQHGAKRAPITVKAVTRRRRRRTCPALEEVALPAAGLASIPLTDPSAIDAQLVVLLDGRRCSSSGRCPGSRAPQGRTTTWAVPVM